MFSWVNLARLSWILTGSKFWGFMFCGLHRRNKQRTFLGKNIAIVWWHIFAQPQDGGKINRTKRIPFKRIGIQSKMLNCIYQYTLNNNIFIFVIACMETESKGTPVMLNWIQIVIIDIAEISINKSFDLEVTMVDWFLANLTEKYKGIWQIMTNLYFSYSNDPITRLTFDELQIGNIKPIFCNVSLCHLLYDFQPKPIYVKLEKHWCYYWVGDHFLIPKIKYRWPPSVERYLGDFDIRICNIMHLSACHYIPFQPHVWMYIPERRRSSNIRDHHSKCWHLAAPVSLNCTFSILSMSGSSCSELSANNGFLMVTSPCQWARYFLLANQLIRTIGVIARRFGVIYR